MRRSPGQSTSEYGIILALVAVIAIPVLIMFGGNLKTGISSMIPDSGQPQVQVASTQLASEGGGAPTNGSNELSGFQSSYDAENGTITYTLPESSGGGAVTTSVEGVTGELANVLTQLANTWKDSAGKPMDPGIKEYLLTLAATGYDIAGKQGPPLPGRNNDLIWRSDDFAADYNNVAQKLDALSKQNPDYANLKTTIDGYAGTISYVNYTQFLQADSIAANNNMASDFLVGTKPTNMDNITPKNASAVTAASAYGIESTAK